MEATIERTKRVREILSSYKSENAGVLTNLARLLEDGALAGTGKLLILPVNQGFEHGPGRSFGGNPAAYDPPYLFDLAIQSGCNAFAAPLGLFEAAVADYAVEIPLILK
jgi:class I fructose-bisphosphate aldolase